MREILDACLKNSGMIYEIGGDGVIVIKKERPKANPQQENFASQGVVKDQTCDKLPGVDVVVRGTSLGISTDIKGEFKINLPGDLKDPVLLFSFIGMKSMEVKYTGQALNIVLEDDTSELAEVVVTGVFDRPRESYTGAVTTITAKELRGAGNRSVMSLSLIPI